ncbi:hypothetical protein C8F01DRAFT_1360542 [Mycena amicta]|nr:hypothetical protein C8F01DRAFT_1360542 [Mycena amicta]
MATVQHPNSDADANSSDPLISDRHRNVLDLLDALQSGRLRIVDPPPENATFKPRMEIFDHPTSPSTIATFELPGVKAEHLTLGVKNDTLVVRGRRVSRFALASGREHRARREPRGRLEAGKDSDESHEAHQRRRAQYKHLGFFPWRELRYGNFHRTVNLPRGVDTTTMTASLADGLLTVTWERPAKDQAAASTPDNNSANTEAMADSPVPPTANDSEDAQYESEDDSGLVACRPTRRGIMNTTGPV